MAVTAPEVERVDSLRMTSECPNAEKPSPPYSFGMIMAKNLWRLRKSHTSGGRSHSSKVICQSLSMWQSSLTGPSRNACSSAVSRDGATASSFAQSGLPANRSASHHTSPASIASRSVSESVGSTWRAQPKIGLDDPVPAK